jgi:hypothetical protein
MPFFDDICADVKLVPLLSGNCDIQFLFIDILVLFVYNLLAYIYKAFN